MAATMTTTERKVGTMATTPYDVVMTYLHSLNMTAETKRSVGHSLMDEARREDARLRMREQFRLKKDLELFATYKDNWDGDGGLPLSEDVLHNFEELLPYLSSNCLLQIDIYPENNGSLLVMWRNKEAGINIGSNTYTYYQTNGDEVEGKSHLPFSVDDVLETAERLAA